MPDHVHIMISIPPKYSVAQVIGFIKGKSAIHIDCDIQLIYRCAPEKSRGRTVDEVFGMDRPLGLDRTAFGLCYRE